jgi:hypothetical protein
MAQRCSFSVMISGERRQMFSHPTFQLNILAFAVASAFSVPAFADDIASANASPVNPAQTYSPQPGVFDIERANTAIAGQIKADAAYAQGITGKGVTIAVLDTGITASDTEFSQSGKILQGYNAITGSANVTDQDGHGTHVAGIIAADRDGSGMFGIAYDARLLPIKVFADNGIGSTAYLDSGLQYVIGRAPIVNMSLTTSSSFNASTVQQAVNAGLLIIAAAGNSSAANPEWPARFAKEAWANNQIIAVGAVDANNQIASFSNRGGDTAAWFLVAPGVNIPSTYLNNQYVYMSGTSMATPIVSAAAALIKQRWSYLRADQIANILFITATDLGAPGIDPIYGRGLLNIEKAMQPVGTVTTTTWNGASIKVLNTSITPSAATSALWNFASTGVLHIVGRDDFSRDFNIDLGSSVSRPVAMSLEQVFGSLDQRVNIAQRVLPDGSHLVAAYASRIPETGSLQFDAFSMPHTRLAGFSYVSARKDGMEMAFGAGGMEDSYFGVGGIQVIDGLATVPALANPYFALVPSASHAAIAQNFSSDIKLKFGMLSSGLTEAFRSQDTIWSPAGQLNTAPKVNTALFELSRQLSDAAVSVSFSRTNELDAYLGAQASGVLAFGSNTVTNAMQIASAWQFAPHWALASQVAYGITFGNTNNNSLITNMSTSRSNAFSLAVVANDRLMENDRFSFSVSQPMRAYTGTITLNVMNGVDGNGTEIREQRSLSMVPEDREIMTEMSYRMPSGKNAFTAFEIAIRQNPNNFADVPMEKLLAIRYLKQF